MKDDDNEESEETICARIPPGCDLGSTLGGTLDSGGSTTMGSTGMSTFSEFCQSPSPEMRLFSSTMLDDWPFSHPGSPKGSAARPQAADLHVLEDLRKAIEADTELLPGGSELRQRTWALRQKTLDLIARDSSLGSWDAAPQVYVGYPHPDICTAPHCARPGILPSQCPRPSYMHGDEVWKERCIRERKFFPAPLQTTPQEDMEKKNEIDAVAPCRPRNDKAGLQFSPRPAVRRVGHGPRGGIHARKHIALIGGP